MPGIFSREENLVHNPYSQPNNNTQLPPEAAQYPQPVPNGTPVQGSPAYTQPAYTQPGTPGQASPAYTQPVANGAPGQASPAYTQPNPASPAAVTPHKLETKTRTVKSRLISAFVMLLVIAGYFLFRFFNTGLFGVVKQIIIPAVLTVFLIISIISLVRIKKQRAEGKQINTMSLTGTIIAAVVLAALSIGGWYYEGVPAILDLSSGPVTVPVKVVGTDNYESYSRYGSHEHDVVGFQLPNGETFEVDLGSDAKLEAQVLSTKQGNLTIYPRTNIFVSFKP